MNTISLAMIVKNEEKILERCLNSIKDLVDEIVIIDTGSIDNTKKIAKKFTSKVFDFKWVNDFSLARNFSFSKCSCDYIMWLDADDVFDKTQSEQFLELKQELNNYDVIMCMYNIAFDQQNTPTFSYYRERIIKNNGKYFWIDPVHEVIQTHGKIIYSNLSINHCPNKTEDKTNRNLKIYQSLIKNKVSLSPRQQFYYARELLLNEKIKQAIKQFNNFLSQKNIWTENAISACRDLSKCYLLQHNTKRAKESLLHSFVFDTPRAESCCELADIFLKECNFAVAIYWYKVALTCQPNLKSGAFVEFQYYDEIPHLQLCYCYYQTGQTKLSEYHNKKVGEINPQNQSYLHNKKIFESE